MTTNASPNGFADFGLRPDLLEGLARIGFCDPTPIQKAAFIGRIQQYNLPKDYVERQNKILQGITKPEIDALAKKWIDTDRMNILLVGDKAKILPGLQKTGYEIVELDVEGNPKK